MVRKKGKKISVHREKAARRKKGVLLFKIAGLLMLVFVLGAAALAYYSGNKPQRGSAKAGESCNSNFDCAAGFYCYSHNFGPDMCYAACTDSSDCKDGYSCEMVTNQKSRKISTLKICIL